MKPSSNGSAQVIRRLRAIVRGHDQSISAQIFRGASSTTVLKVLNAGLGFGTAILLARFLGVTDYGTYAYAMSWITLIGVFAGLGLGQVVVADVAVYHKNADWGHIHGILRFSLAAVAAAAIVCALAMTGVAWLMHRDDQALYAATLLASLLLPLNALMQPLGATQNGLGRVANAQIPSLLIFPATFLVLVAIAFGLNLVEPSPTTTIGLQLIAVSTGLAVALLLLFPALAKAGRPQVPPPPQYAARLWITRALPMTVIAGVALLNANADILMLGSMVGPEASGLYKAASRGAELVAFSLAVLYVPLGPLTARLYNAGQRWHLQQTISRWARIAFFPSALLAAVFVFRGDWFLSLFGTDFSNDKAATCLSILSASQLAVAAAGPAGLLLIMTKHERLAAVGVSIMALINVALNAAFIPVWQETGAAAATAVSTVLLCVMLVVFVMMRLKVNPTIFAVTSSGDK